MLYQLIAVFAVLSVLGFGGGNAILPQMYADVVTQYHWITGEQFAKYFALARMSPGPGMTVSALIGYIVAGWPGAIVAATAMFLPAAVIVYGLALVWERYRDHAWRKIFSRAMIPIVLGLSWVGVVVLSRGGIDTPLTYAIAGIACTAMLVSRVNAALLILSGAIAGLAFLR